MGSPTSHSRTTSPPAVLPSASASAPLLHSPKPRLRRGAMQPTCVTASPAGRLGRPAAGALPARVSRVARIARPPTTTTAAAALQLRRAGRPLAPRRGAPALRAASSSATSQSPPPPKVDRRVPITVSPRNPPLPALRRKVRVPTLVYFEALRGCVGDDFSKCIGSVSNLWWRRKVLFPPFLGRGGCRRGGIDVDRQSFSSPILSDKHFYHLYDLTLYWRFFRFSSGPL